MSINVAQIEAGFGQASQVLEAIMQMEPTIAGVAGIFIPQIGLIQPEVLALAPILDQALKAVAAGNGGNIQASLIEIVKHLLPGLPNSPTLSAPAAFPQGS